MKEVEQQIKGDLVMRTIAMPSDTNANGDIFGGWLLSQMDLGGGIVAKSNSTSGRAVTVSIDSMSFINPVKVGDMVSCYAELISHGRTSMKIQIEAWTYSYITREAKHVTSGIFTYVAIDEHGHPCPVKGKVAEV
ncbi:MAG: acyl-CoA thioesterase [Proteobacteria bacterium]|nr:MAG: acyl-CoA thioesterase [Pseudomonadota bacterium]